MKMKKLIVLLFTSLLSLNVCARVCGPKWLEKAVFYHLVKALVDLRVQQAAVAGNQRERVQIERRGGGGCIRRRGKRGRS